jgi:hypothetical protein
MFQGVYWRGGKWGLFGRKYIVGGILLWCGRNKVWEVSMMGGWRNGIRASREKGLGR